MHMCPKVLNLHQFNLSYPVLIKFLSVYGLNIITGKLEEENSSSYFAIILNSIEFQFTSGIWKYGGGEEITQHTAMISKGLVGCIFQVCLDCLA